MGRMRLAVMGLFLTVIITTPAMAYLVTYDFESLSANTYYDESTFSANFSDVIFDNIGGDGFTVGLVGSNSFFTNAIYNNNDNNNSSGNATEVVFDNFTTNYVSVDFKIHLMNEGTVYMQGYNYFGSNYVANPNLYSEHNINGNDWITLSISDNGILGIKKVRFWSKGTISVPGLGSTTIYNTIYWDNFTFNKSSPPNTIIPEPSTFFLVLSSLLSLFSVKFKIHKKA